MAKYAPSYESQSLARRMAGPLFIVFSMFYLGFHAVSGERGLLALMTESHRLDVLKTELAEVKIQRELLERKTRHLSDNSLDLDLLDEQSRRVLGLAGKNEVMVLPPQ